MAFSPGPCAGDEVVNSERPIAPGLPSAEAFIEFAPDPTTARHSTIQRSRMMRGAIIGNAGVDPPLHRRVALHKNGSRVEKVVR